MAEYSVLKGRNDCTIVNYRGDQTLLLVQEGIKIFLKPFIIITKLLNNIITIFLTIKSIGGSVLFHHWTGNFIHTGDLKTASSFLKI